MPSPTLGELTLKNLHLEAALQIQTLLHAMHWCRIAAEASFNHSLCCSEQKGDPEDYRLQEEMKAYGDILRLDVVDSYDDLSKKTLKMFTVLPQKIDAYFYFKVDDDVALNIDAMEAYLQERKNQGNLYLVSLLVFISIDHLLRHSDGDRLKAR